MLRRKSICCVAYNEPFESLCASVEKAAHTDIYEEDLLVKLCEVAMAGALKV